MKRRKILTVIPARKGSKRVPLKNIREICGKPLLHYAIEAAKGAFGIKDILVSTESMQIAECAKQAGVEVLTRSSVLASDEVPLALVMRKVLEIMDRTGKYYDAILSLQATSPLITRGTLDDVINIFHEKDCSAVATVTRIRHGHPHLSKRLSYGRANNFIDVPAEMTLYPKRNLEAAYYFNGAVFLRDRSLLVDYDYTTNALGNRVTVVKMSDEESVNIDTEYDFKIARLLLEDKND